MVDKNQFSKRFPSQSAVEEFPGPLYLTEQGGLFFTDCEMDLFSERGILFHKGIL